MILPIIVYDRLYVPITNGDDDFYLNLYQQLTYKNPDYIKLQRINKWVGETPEYIRNYEKVNLPQYNECLSIPRGTVSKLRRIAKLNDIKLSFIDKRISLQPISNYENNVVLWPEQEKLANIMYRKQNCLIRSPTASGKTELSLKLTEWLLNDVGPVLIIVWETGLLNQWVDKISIRFGIPHDEVGVISGKKKQLKPITVAMQQTLKNSIDKYKDCFGAVIVDEVQRFAAKTFREVIDKIPAKYRIGISADESRKDKKEFLIYDSFGEVAGEIEKIVLIQKNKIIEPIIRIIPTTYNHIQRYGSAETYIEVQWQNLPADQKDYNTLLDNLTECEDRNDFIWQFIEPALKVGKMTIIGSTRVNNAIYWDKRICEAGYETGLMLGGIKRADEYEKTVNGLQQKKIQVGIGTVQKIGVGLDITPLERLFIVTPLASNRQKFDQAVGRMRRTSKGKEDAVVYYFWDKKLFPAHKTNLQKYYKGYSQIYTDGEFVNC